MEKMLKDRVAIITGSGRGIGQAAAMTFASEGARVVVSDLDVEPAQATVEAIRSAGGQAVCYVGDVSAPDFAEQVVAKAIDTWGALQDRKSTRLNSSH